jgi:LacI family transcriptional regulator
MKITIKKIAELANVSRGTVDRVIHGRPGVKDDVRERVENILNSFEYKPNLAGKALVNTRKNIKIGVVLSPDFNPFIDEVKRGIEFEAQSIEAYGVGLDVEVISIFDENEQLEILNKLQRSGITAIAIVPVDTEIIRLKINELVEAGIPVVTFNSDISGTRRLCFVGQDNFKAGRTVGELALKILPRPASVGIISSNMNLSCHQNRTNGFNSKINEAGGVQVKGFEQNNDVDKTAYAITRDFIKGIEDLRLIYLTGGGVGGVGRALKELGKASEVRVICHDIIPDSIRLLNESVIDFVIGQDPFRQGHLPIKILFDFIFQKELPENEIYHTGVDIYTGENVSGG